MNIVTNRKVIDLQENDLDYYQNDLSSDSEYKIYLTKPIILDDETLSSFDSYLGADGEMNLPFDGKKELETFIDEDGDRYYCSADGENFYNAKGENIKGFFKKVGGGVVKAGKAVGKAGKFIGKNIAKAARWVAKKSKTAVKGVKNLGKNIKTKGKALKHQKKVKKEKSSGGGNEKPNSNAPDLTKPEANKETQPNNEDVFTKPLEKATPSTPPEKVVDVEGQKFSTEGLDEDKPITVSTDPETGNKIVGVDYQPSEVVAVTGNDGYVEYYTPESVGMSKGLKIGLIIGVSVVGATLIGFLIYRLTRKK